MLITDQKTLNAKIEAFSKHKFITVDTEFLREKTYYPKLCLIQISGPDKDPVAIDTIEGDLDLSPVFDLLANEKILKVFHAARQDLEIFFNLTGKVVHPIFDTQIAAMVCGYGDSIGYESLVRNITGGELDKSAQYTNWSHRPLSDKQLNYALGDVTHLIDLYLHLSEQLEKQGRTEWVFEEEGILADPNTYNIDPYETWRRVKIKSPKPKALAILRELAAWREKQAQKRDIPRPWVLRDETLADIAGQAPRNIKGLQKIRNIPGDLEKRDLGKILLSLIQKAVDSDPETWPAVKKKKPLPPRAAATVDILRMLLKIQAAESDVASKLIASADDLEQLALHDNPDIPALKGWRHEVFGKAALELKKGHLAIGLKESKIVRFKTDSDSETF